MKEIKAREGYYLTQVGEVVNRVFVRALKGANIKEDDWREATEEEKREYEQLNEDTDKEIGQYEEPIV